MALVTGKVLTQGEFATPVEAMEWAKGQLETELRDATNINLVITSVGRNFLTRHKVTYTATVRGVIGPVFEESP
jgi:hypothetical protein